MIGGIPSLHFLRCSCLAFLSLSLSLYQPPPPLPPLLGAAAGMGSSFYTTNALK